MKTALLLLALITGTLAFADHQNIVVKVDGMVCSFCSQGIEKKLSPHAAKVHVDLNSKVVSISPRHDHQITDEEIKAWIRDAGYSVVSIQR